MGSWQISPLASNWHFLQQALFLSLNTERGFRSEVRGQRGERERDKTREWSKTTCVSDLHWAPSLSLHSAVQQRSELMCSSPGSHSSPCSTREFPHTLMFLSLKQDWAFDFRRFSIERLLQLENSWTHKRELNQVTDWINPLEQPAVHVPVQLCLVQVVSEVLQVTDVN